jgi:hypothetical protein
MKFLKGFLSSRALALLLKFLYHITPTLCQHRIIYELLIVQYPVRNLDQSVSVLLSVFIDLQTEVSNAIYQNGQELFLLS